MSRQKNLTTNSRELTIGKIFSGDYIYSIPRFQRSYKWNKDKALSLLTDICDIISEESESHFMGAIIFNTRKSKKKEIIRELIDGQQRIITIFIIICAVIRVISESGKHKLGSSYLKKYIFTNRKSITPTDFKIIASVENRIQINRIIDDVLSIEKLRSCISVNFAFESKNDPRMDGQIWKNYQELIKNLREFSEDHGISYLPKIVRSLMTNTSLVAIEVYDALKGPKIFDSLNSKQQTMTIGDLVKNEVLSRVMDRDEATVEKYENKAWTNFYNSFSYTDKEKNKTINFFDDYFFPFGLVSNHKVKKSDTFNYLRKSWAKLQKPEQIIKSLSEYRYAFIDLVTGQNLQNHKNGKVINCFSNLYHSKLPTSALPFLMHVSNAHKKKIINSKSTINILLTIESFLVRRAICGIEPTGLHAVFKGLWEKIKKNPNSALIEKIIRELPTVAWPTDEEVKKAIMNRPLHKSSIVKYLLRTYDIECLHGDTPKDTPEIEHVLPKTLSQSWETDFNKSDHKKMVGLLANLIPLSKTMNSSITNLSYKEKRKKYKNKSMFITARNFAATYSTWTPAQIEKRSKKLATWAVKRWNI